jgi:ADP-ribose pyrophosphatase
MHDAKQEKILLNCEFRMAVNQWVYNFPAGLIDEGESAQVAAARELKEETGLDLESVSEVWKESYSAVGFSNEKVVVLIGTAAGTMKPSDSEFEEIKAGWFTKEEVRALLNTEMFAARTQAYCMLWSKDR